MIASYIINVRLSQIVTIAILMFAIDLSNNKIFKIARETYDKKISYSSRGSCFKVFFLLAFSAYQVHF